MVDQSKRGRGGNVKIAPPGYYTARQAYERLGMNKQQFYKNVGTLITRVVLPGSKDGMYIQEEINLLATLRQRGLMENVKLPPTTFRQAIHADAQGIVDVLESLGWKTTTAELRIKWYQVNPEIDHVVLQGNLVMGYLSATPYTDEVMDKIVRGQVKGWQIKPEDILPFEEGNTYDLFVGLAERKKPQDKPEQYARYGLRLVLGFREFLVETLRNRNIRIRFLLANSAEKDGQNLADALGFVKQERSSEDRYPIYILDMEHSDALWVQRYRALWEWNEFVT